MNYHKSNIYRSSSFFYSDKSSRHHPSNRSFRAVTKDSHSSSSSTQKSNLVQKSIESSNKLDELLKKCQQIGSSQSLDQISPKFVQNPNCNSNLTKISDYKLVKNDRPCQPANLNHLTKESSRVYKKASRFKLVKQKPMTIKINLNSLLSQSLVNIRPKCTRHPPGNRSILWKTLKKNKYKLSNIKKNTKLLNKNQFKYIDNQASRLNKYKLINSNNLHRTRIDAGKKILLANNLVNRSKLTINRTIKKTHNQSLIKKSATNIMNLNNKLEKKYCLFYNRFGRCSRGESCPYIHDPQRVSLCPRFLRGTCKVENCPFSHETNPEKIPVCSYFASGCCNRENCPYQHIFYGKDAKFCVNFAKGYCPLGSKCENLHLIECPEFEKNKKCPRGKKCPLLHRKKKKHHKKESNDGENETLVFVPDFKTSDEKIKIFETKESKNDLVEKFKLRPSFNIKKTNASK